MKGNILNLVFKRMAEGYEEQVPSYEKMLELAKEQQAVLAQEEVDIDKLLKLIDQRQELIVLLSKMNEGLASLKEEIKEALEIDEFNMSKIKMSYPTGRRSIICRLRQIRPNPHSN